MYLLFIYQFILAVANCGWWLCCFLSILGNADAQFVMGVRLAIGKGMTQSDEVSTALSTVLELYVCMFNVDYYIYEVSCYFCD